MSDDPVSLHSYLLGPREEQAFYRLSCSSSSATLHCLELLQQISITHPHYLQWGLEVLKREHRYAVATKTVGRWCFARKATIRQGSHVTLCPMTSDDGSWKGGKDFLHAACSSSSNSGWVLMVIVVPLQKHYMVTRHSTSISH